MSGNCRRRMDSEVSSSSDADADHNNSPRPGSKRSAHSSGSSGGEPGRKRRRLNSSVSQMNSNNNNSQISLVMSDDSDDNDADEPSRRNLRSSRKNGQNGPNSRNSRNSRNNSKNGKNRKNNNSSTDCIDSDNEDNNNSNKASSPDTREVSASVSSSASVTSGLVELDQDESNKKNYHQRMRKYKAQDEETRRSKQWCAGTQKNSERVEIRQKYRELAETTLNERQDMMDPQKPNFLKALQKQRKLYAKVQETQEAHMDMQQTSRMSEILKGETTKLANENFTISCKDLVNAVKRRFKRREDADLHERHGNNSNNSSSSSSNSVRDERMDGVDVDWVKLGRKLCGGVECNTRFIKTAPVVGIELNSAALHKAWILDEKEQKRMEKIKNEENMDEDEKERKKQMKLKRANRWKSQDEQKVAKQVSYEDAKHNKNKTETKSRVTHLNKLLKKKCDEFEGDAANNEGIGMFPFIVNPESYSETVENLFDLSFMAKEGTALIAPSQSGGANAGRNGSNGNNGGNGGSEPMVKFMPKEGDKGVNNGQCIVKMDFEIFQNLVEYFGIKESQVKRKRKHKKGAAGGAGSDAEMDDFIELDENESEGDEDEAQQSDANESEMDENNDDDASENENESDEENEQSQSQANGRKRNVRNGKRGGGGRAKNAKNGKNGKKSDKREIDDDDTEDEDDD